MIHQHQCKGYYPPALAERCAAQRIIRYTTQVGCAVRTLVIIII